MGVVDRRFSQACPWMGLKVGHRVRIDHFLLERYDHSLFDYLMTIIRRLGVKYELDVDWKIQFTSEQEGKDEEVRDRQQGPVAENRM
jgi:hypothetical protein